MLAERKSLLNIFEIVKQNISVWEAAERYEVDINRSRMARCPFHNDHTPSLLIADDHFHCFGCGEHGDVIDFVSKLFQISAYDSARKLMHDFGLGPTPPAEAVVAIPVKHSGSRRKAENDCYLLLRDYLSLLREQKLLYAPVLPMADLDTRFVEACYQLPHAEYLMDEWLCSSDEERTSIMENEDIQRIKKRLTQEKEGVIVDGKKAA